MGSTTHHPDASGPESSGNLFPPQGSFLAIASFQLLPPKFAWIATQPDGESGSCRGGDDSTRQSNLSHSGLGFTKQASSNDTDHTAHFT